MASISMAQSSHPTVAGPFSDEHAVSSHSFRGQDMEEGGDVSPFPDGFLWGAATAGHQVEG